MGFALGVLDKINSSNDIKKLNSAEIDELCGELRQRIIDTVSKTGGHLASNLGTVELTVALHRVFDTEVDRLIFDVGHQCYSHKLITGRREQFSTLRSYCGISGFPKPHESVNDAFIAGHASNSVSVALGMAKARTLAGANYDVVAVIGDGALTGGLSYEGLAAAAASGEPMVIILNDNNMSIDVNVGGTAQLLQKMRVKSSYISFKRWYRGALAHTPRIYEFNHRIKEWLKSRLLRGNMFNAMGLNYMGPVDGHDVEKLETVIRWAKEMREPVIVHVLTKKGNGCKYAEEHPDLYHGVGKFDPQTGEIYPSESSFSENMGEFLCELAEKDGRITAITAAMSLGTGLDRFAKAFPKRFIDAGIAEGHATAFTAGMAKQGALPVFAVYSSFLQRGYDMLIHDISLLDLHAVFCVDRAGIVGSDGETHHGIFDVSYLCSVPGMTVFCPASFAELRDMMRAALYDTEGPVALRYPRGGEGEYTASCIDAESVILTGSDITIACYGTMINEALSAARLLAENGVKAEIVKLGRICPNDFSATLASVKKTGRFIAAEEVCAAGCVGERILAAAALNGIRVDAAALLNLGMGIVRHGGRDKLMRDHGIDAASIAAAAMRLCADGRDDEKGQT